MKHLLNNYLYWVDCSILITVEAILLHNLPLKSLSIFSSVSLLSLFSFWILVLWVLDSGRGPVVVGAMLFELCISTNLIEQRSQSCPGVVPEPSFLSYWWRRVSRSRWSTGNRSRRRRVSLWRWSTAIPSPRLTAPPWRTPSQPPSARLWRRPMSPHPMLLMLDITEPQSPQRPLLYVVNLSVFVLTNTQVLIIKILRVEI